MLCIAAYYETSEKLKFVIARSITTKQSQS